MYAGEKLFVILAYRHLEIIILFSSIILKKVLSPLCISVNVGFKIAQQMQE